MSYATVQDVIYGFRELNAEERARCNQLLIEADILIDSYREDAKQERKKVAKCRMVRRALGSGQAEAFPIGATTGTVSALGYSQTFSMASGSTGELYVGKEEKKLLGASNRIGAKSPLEGLKND